MTRHTRPLRIERVTPPRWYSLALIAIFAPLVVLQLLVMVVTR